MTIRTDTNYAHLKIDIPRSADEALSERARNAGISKAQLVRNIIDAFTTGDTNDQPDPHV